MPDLAEDEESQSRIFGIAGTASSAVSAASAVLAGILMPLDVGTPFLVAGIAAAVALTAGVALLWRSKTTLSRTRALATDEGAAP